MQIVDLLFPPQLAQSLGWTLLHSLWQGAVLALGLRLFLRMLRGRSPQTAYIASLCTLVLMLGASIVTLYIEYQDALAMMAVANNPMVVWAPVDQMAPALLESGGLVWEQTIPWLSVVWLTGLVFFAVRWLGGLWYLQRLRVSYTFEVDYGWQHKLNQLARKMGISRTVTLLESGRVQVPMVLGHLKPVILLPLGLLSGISPKQLESILAHELSHIHRYDFLINQILALVEMVFFYHPAYWWVSNQIEENREHCCDDMAVAVCEDAITYARMLTELEARRQNMPMMALGMAGRKNGLFRRVERIVQPQARSTQKEKASIIPAIILTSCLIGLVWTKPQAQTPEPTPAPEIEVPVANLPLTVTTKEVVAPEPSVAPSANAQLAPVAANLEVSVPQGEPAIGEPILYWDESAAPMVAEPVFVNLSPDTDILIADLDNLVLDLDRTNILLARTANQLVMVVDSPPLPPIPPVPPMITMPTLPTLPNIDWEDEEQRAAYEAEMKEFAKAQKEWAKEFEKNWAKDGKSWEKEMEAFQREMQIWQEEFQKRYADELHSGEMSPEMREDMRRMNEERRGLERLHAEKAREQAQIAREQARVHAEVARVEARQQSELIRQQAQLQAELARVEARVVSEQARVQAELARREIDALRANLDMEARANKESYFRYQDRLLRELERDGLIDSGDSRVKVDITEDYVKVNGRRLNRILAKKYRSMAEDYNVEEGRIIFREK